VDNFKAVYHMLSALERAMDCAEFDINEIGPEVLGVSRQRWARYLEMMLDVGYIRGVTVKQTITGDLMVENEDIRITLKGLEYLQENSIMKQIYKAMKGIKEAVPFV